MEPVAYKEGPNLKFDLKNPSKSIKSAGNVT